MVERSTKSNQGKQEIKIRRNEKRKRPEYVKILLK